MSRGKDRHLRCETDRLQDQRPEISTGNQQGKQVFFEKKPKNFCSLGRPPQNHRDSRTKSLLLLFFRKEGLPFLPDS